MKTRSSRAQHGLLAVMTALAVAFSANCYLIRHARGMIPWDSGISERVASLWINRDNAQSETIPKSPAYIE